MDARQTLPLSAKIENKRQAAANGKNSIVGKTSDLIAKSAYLTLSRVAERNAIWKRRTPDAWNQFRSGKRTISR